MTLPRTLEVRHAPIPTFEWNFPCLESDPKMIFEQRSEFIMILRNDIQPFFKIQVFSFTGNRPLAGIRQIFLYVDLWSRSCSRPMYRYEVDNFWQHVATGPILWKKLRL